MEFRTIVNLPTQRIQLTPSSRVLFIGSCFSDHIGRHMSESLPEGHTEINPNGVLYNPGSIFVALQLLLNGTAQLSESTFFQGRDGLWRNWLYAGEFAANTLEACYANIIYRQQEAAQIFNKADALFVTFSTDHGYFLQPDCNPQSLVANCHKEPSQRFTEAILPFSYIIEEGCSILQQLKQKLPQLQIVFTLSPYRYRKYGFHESQVSKARLLHAIDELCAHNDNAFYFPAYEIVVDELRDYRFYSSDMLHPSDQAVDYVWERLKEWAFSSQLREYAQEKAALLRDLGHRPLHPESTAALQFQEQLEIRKSAFMEKWKL